LPHSLLKKLDSVQCAFLRTATNADSFTPNAALLAELGAQSLTSRREELQLRFFRHLCTTQNRRLTCVFRFRCAQVRRGSAKLSVCNAFKSLLHKYDCTDIWLSLPRARSHPLWIGWESKVHQKAVAFDLATRKAAIESRPSLSVFTHIKPLEQRVVPDYLSQKGLGAWLKIKLRTGSLPLKEMLGRHCKPPLVSEQVTCALCESGEVEDVPHFLCSCAALAPERESFLTSLSQDRLFTAGAAARATLAVLRGGSPPERVVLLLSSHERPHGADFGTDPQPEPGHANGSRTASASHALTSTRDLGDPSQRRFESLTLRFLITIWRRRASLLGGVPALDVHASKLVLAQLAEDGRCRAFAVGPCI